MQQAVVKTVEELKRDALLLLPRLPRALRLSRASADAAVVMILCAILRKLRVTHGLMWRGWAGNENRLTFIVDSAELEEALAEATPEELEKAAERGAKNLAILFQAGTVGWLEKLLATHIALEDYRIHVDDEEEGADSQ